jgi:hypothetical protein
MSLMAAATMASLLIGSRRRRAVRVGERCQGGGGTSSLGELAAPLAPLSLFRLGSLVIGRRFSLACAAPRPTLPGPTFAGEQRTALERSLTGTSAYDRTLFE